MRTVISHIFNEAYLMPWWINHHKPLFDYGIFIDYGSTDETLDICRTLAPDWKIVRSRNLTFDSWAADFEIMCYENDLPGWKMSLNTTEFLWGVDFDKTEKLLVDQGLNGCHFDYFVMVDPFTTEEPSHDCSLVLQKHHGYRGLREGDARFEGHGRLFHRAPNGGYLPGRHGSHLPKLARAPDLGAVLWYKFSPWNETFLGRKLQIQTKIPKEERDCGRGHHHIVTSESLNEQYNEALTRTVDLTPMLSGYPANYWAEERTAFALSSQALI